MLALEAIAMPARAGALKLLELNCMRMRALLQYAHVRTRMHMRAYDYV